MTGSFRKLSGFTNSLLEMATGFNVIRKSSLEELKRAAQPPVVQPEVSSPAPPREFTRPTYVMTTLENGISIWLDLSDYGVSRNCLANAYEVAELNFIVNFLKPGNTFVDIGANIGWFSFHAAQRVGQAGKVVAFEPRQNTMRLLEKSVDANEFQSLVELHNCALGDSETSSRVAWMDDMGNPGGTWLMVDAVVERELEATGHSFQETSVMMLDTVLRSRHVDLIKIDIEGAEPFAMRGGVKTLTHVRPTILSEVNAPLLSRQSHLTAAEYIDWYRQFNYRAFLLSETGELAQEIYAGEAPDGAVVNVVFVPR